MSTQKLYDQTRAIFKNKPGKYRPFIFPLNYILYFHFFGRKVPFRHVSSMKSAIVMRDIFKRGGVDLFLYGGALLGSVRQGGLAGRPKDFDFLMKFEDLPLFKKILQELNLHGYKIVRVKLRKGIINIEPPRGCPVSLILYSPDDSSDPRYYKRLLDSSLRPEDLNIESIFTECIYDYSYFDFSLPEFAYYKIPANLSVSLYKFLYGYEFNIPINYEDLIVGQYGSGWAIPDSVQYSTRRTLA